MDTLTSHTLAAAVVEPAVASRSHAGAGCLALVPGHALPHVGHTAVHCHLPRLKVGLVETLGVHRDDLLVDGEEGGHVDIHGEGDDGPPALSVLLVSQGLEESWNVVLQILQYDFKKYCVKDLGLNHLDVGLSGELVNGDVRLGAHVDTGAALAVQIVQALETFLNIIVLLDCCPIEKNL